MSTSIRPPLVAWSALAFALAIPFGGVRASPRPAPSSMTADAAPAVIASAEPAPLHSLDALRCWARDGRACATSPDPLGAVEDAFPQTRVLGSRSIPAGVEATVLRYRRHIADGVVFLYQLDPGGKVLSRRCVEGLPAEGTSLAYARSPDAIEGQRLIYWDRCTLQSACWSSVGRRMAFSVDAEGKLVKQGELGPSTLRDERTDSVSCLFPLISVRLPSGPATVASIKGRAWTAGSDEQLATGQTVQPTLVILDVGSNLLLSVAGTTLRFESDQDAGLRLDLRQDPTLDEVWPGAASLGSDAPLTWADPFLVDREAVYEVKGAELRKACDLENVRTICTIDCLGFREGSGPVVADGTAYFPGPGPVTAGRCRQKQEPPRPAPR